MHPIVSHFRGEGGIVLEVPIATFTSEAKAKATAAVSPGINSI